jgi:hypothetical protein
MGDEGALHLRRADAVAGNVQDVVDTADDPEVPVLVLPGAIAGEIDPGLAGKLGEVLALVALIVAPEGAEHRGPGLGDHQLAAGVPRHLTAALVHHLRHDAEERPRPGTGLGRRHARQRGDHN